MPEAEIQRINKRLELLEHAVNGVDGRPGLVRKMDTLTLLLEQYQPKVDAHEALLVSGADTLTVQMRDIVGTINSIKRTAYAILTGIGGLILPAVWNFALDVMKNGGG